MKFTYTMSTYIHAKYEIATHAKLKLESDFSYYEPKNQYKITSNAVVFQYTIRFKYYVLFDVCYRMRQREREIEK